MARRTPAAVLVPVFRDAGGELRLVLVVRGSGGRHGGQLGLPGGTREPGDRSLLETALREADEEIGLARHDAEVICDATFADGGARRQEPMSFPGWRRPLQIECVVLDGGHLVWGLTLRLLDALVPRLLAGEWQIQ